MKSYIKNIVVLVVTIIIAVIASMDFLSMHKNEEIAQNPSITEIKMLSQYSPRLKGTSLDTEVYFFDSGIEGGTFLILGGTHPNETAGLVAATALIENISVEEGRVIIIPRTNNSGFTHTSPFDGMQDFFTLTLEDGTERTFRVGNRLTNPVHQWPDMNYYEGTSGRTIYGTENAEVRNVNRLYYGTEDGVLTEQVCYGIYNLINEQKKKGTAVIFVGEDLDVLLELSDRILVLCGGEVSGIVDGRTTDKNTVGMMMTRIGGAENEQ